MICPRCTKQTDGIHTCTPTKGWRRLENQRDELLADVERCYRMLLTEPDTKGALFKAENILREAIASVKEKRND